MDGVLLKSDELYAEISSSLFGRVVSPHEMCRYVTKGGVDLFAAVIGENISEEKIDLFRQAQIDYFHPDKHLYDGVEEILNNLSKYYDFSILSNKPEHVIREILRKSNLERLFQYVIGLDSGFQSKPCPDGARFLIKDSKCSKTVFVGDAYSDWLTANRAGIDFIYAKYGFDTNRKSHLIEIQRFSELNNVLNEHYQM
mgnify:CR=1 FL=1